LFKIGPVHLEPEAVSAGVGGDHTAEVSPLPAHLFAVVVRVLAGGVEGGVLRSVHPDHTDRLVRDPRDSSKVVVPAINQSMKIHMAPAR
jgi:hypothetical protein